MCYSKSLFLTASLLVSSSMFAADMSHASYEKKASIEVRFESKKFKVYYDSQESGREFVSDFKKEAGISSEVDIRILVKGAMLDENKLINSYQGIYRFQDQRFLCATIPLSSKKHEKESAVVAQTSVIPSILLLSSTMPSSMQPATMREVSIQWFEAPSKKIYFRDRFNKLEPLVGLKPSDYDGYVDFKKDKSSKNQNLYMNAIYIHLRNDIIRKMEEQRICDVITEMLCGLTSESSNTHQLLTELVKPETIRAVAAFQKLCGKGARKEFQPDEYNESALCKLELDPNKKDFINPFLRRVSPGIDMTIYRFLYSVIGELDGVSVVKDSPLYKILDSLDNSLTELIKQ